MEPPLTPQRFCRTASEAAGIGRKVADVRTRNKPFSVGGALTAAQGPREFSLLRSVGRKIPRLSGHPRKSTAKPIPVSAGGRTDPGCAAFDYRWLHILE
jgi:hypothetical protein